MSDGVWRLEQQTRQLDRARSQAAGLWRDSAAKHVEQRYLSPHSESAARMVSELGAQNAATERADHAVERSREHAAEANAWSELAADAIVQSQRSQASTYEYVEQARRHENEAARIEARALSFAQQAQAACSGCASRNGGVGSAQTVTMRQASNHLTAGQEDAIRYYTGTGAREVMNPALRDPDWKIQDPAGGGKDVESHAATLANAIAGLRNLPAFSGTVYRGTRLDAAELERYKTGDSVVQTFFFSSSRRRETAESFRASSNGNVLFTVNSTNGRDISNYSTYTEREVLFTYATRMRVLDHTIAGGVHHITLEDI